MSIESAIADAVIERVRPELAGLREAIAQRRDERPALLTTRELAHELRCSRATVQRLVTEGLPRTLVIESPRYELKSVLEWLRDRSGGAR